jgi:hypothetical protein
MFIQNWRLEQLLLNRKRGGLKVTAWPDVKRCLVTKNFTYRGRALFAFDRFKGINADSIELEAGPELRELVKGGLVAAYPPADRFRCGPQGITGWRPWAKIVGPTHDWEGRGGLDVFDDCMVRVGIVGPRFRREGICAGLSLSAEDDPVYLPFGLIRARGGYHCEDDTEQLGTIRVYLDEWAPSPVEESIP